MRLIGEYNVVRIMIVVVDRFELGMLVVSCWNKVKYFQFIVIMFCKIIFENKLIEGGDVVDVMKDMLEELDMGKQKREDGGMVFEVESEVEIGGGCFDKSIREDIGKEASSKENESKQIKGEES